MAQKQFKVNHILKIDETKELFKRLFKRKQVDMLKTTSLKKMNEFF